MSPEQMHVLDQCTRQSLTGEITFPEIVNQLMQVGVERYHVDYTRHEVTYYLENGESRIVPLLLGTLDIARSFSSSAVAGAVLQSQRNEHGFSDFVRKTAGAGCVGYFAQLTGRCVQYFGRQGEMHEERFPDKTDQDGGEKNAREQ